MIYETINVEFYDADHVWIKGRQFVSLKRFAEMRQDNLIEMKLLINKIDELTAENEALRALVKKTV
jgi:hypothetical protein